jgi:hypothetical protein
MGRTHHVPRARRERVRLAGQHNAGVAVRGNGRQWVAIDLLGHEIEFGQLRRNHGRRGNAK